MRKLILLATSAVVVLPHIAQAGEAAAEPEQMDYVKVCDVYGAGFYYIPGTETCLRISGYVRHDIGVGELLGADTDGDKKGDTYFQRSRFALRTDARSQTEMGELRAYAQINFDYDTGGAIFSYKPDFGVTNELFVNHAYVELGGFRVGVTDSAFVTFTDYAGEVMSDWFLGYGPFRTSQVAYTYAGSNGFSATVAAEGGAGAYLVDNYMPHLVAGAALTQGWGKVSGVAGYDSINEVWAGKARLDAKVNDRISLFAMAGYKSDTTTPNFYGRWSGDWAVWIGASAKVADKASLNTQLSYDDGNNLVAAANVEYELVKDFKITPEIIYKDNLDVDGGGSLGGLIRFQRSF